MKFIAAQAIGAVFSMMVKWRNDGLHKANDGKMLVNDGQMLVNDGEMSVIEEHYHH